MKSLEKAFSVITNCVNISWRKRVVWPTKGTGGLQYHKLIFDRKQHPKNIWVPWMLKSPLTSVLINCSSDCKTIANSWHLAMNFKSLSRWLEHFFLTAGPNNFGYKIPFLKNKSNFDFNFLGVSTNGQRSLTFYNITSSPSGGLIYMNDAPASVFGQVNVDNEEVIVYKKLKTHSGKVEKIFKR